MNNEEQNISSKIEEIPPKMHGDIMRSVQVVRKRYYLFGLITFFVAILALMVRVVYIKMSEEGTFEFLPVMVDIIKSNLSLVTDFSDEIFEFFPIENIGIIILVLTAVIILLLIVFRFRKALFLKVDKFSDRKNNQKSKK